VTTTRPKAPTGLGTRGKRVWRRLHDHYAFSPAETELVVEVCRTVDTLEQLAEVVAADGTTSIGSKGQTVAHPALQELRQQRIALGRLLAQLDVEDVDGRAVPSPQTLRARTAAAARWAG
jgi:P27 family predicted phage terminase small subunit